MKKQLRIILYIICLVITLSCSNKNNDSYLNNALVSVQKNRHELECVLSHYADDTVKLKAAEFLISNMPGHYSYTKNSGIIINKYYEAVDSIIEHNKHLPIQVIADSINYLAKSLRIDTLSIVQDIEIITAEFLINNIDQAFDRWKRVPWCRHLTFEEFCEYILPYKTTELQPLEPWRDIFRYYNDKYLADYEFCDEISHSTYEAAKAFNKYLTVKFAPKFTNKTLYYFPLQPNIAIKMPFGNCSSFSQAAIPAFRSIGIPLSIDYVPACGHKNGSHTWNSAQTNTGRLMCFVGLTEGFENQQLMNYRIPKVYRRTYSINREIERMNKVEKYVPPLFRNIFQRDVTNEYVQCTNLSLNLNEKNGFIFLAVSSGENWEPIDFSELKSGKAKFENISPGNVYLILRYDEKGFQHPLSYPFLVERDGVLRYFSPTDTVQNITITRKYPVRENSWIYARQLINGFFEAADKPDFHNSTIVGSINDAWVKWHNISIDKSVGAHRFWRYNNNAVTSQAPLAEIEFIEKGTGLKIKGKIISGNTGENGYPPENAFDDNILTAYCSPTTGTWIGMDFGRPVELERIRFVPRGDGNCVEPGDEYELFYWSKSGWKSLENQLAKENHITFSNVPVGTLYLLIDKTKGTEHRIFTYNNGKQEFR